MTTSTDASERRREILSRGLQELAPVQRTTVLGHLVHLLQEGGRNVTEDHRAGGHLLQGPQGNEAIATPHIEQGLPFPQVRVVQHGIPDLGQRFQDGL